MITSEVDLHSKLQEFLNFRLQNFEVKFGKLGRIIWMTKEILHLLKYRSKVKTNFIFLEFKSFRLGIKN